MGSGLSCCWGKQQLEVMFNQTGLLTDLLFTALASVTPQEVQNKQEDSLFTLGGW